MKAKNPEDQNYLDTLLAYRESCRAYDEEVSYCIEYAQKTMNALSRKITAGLELRKLNQEALRNNEIKILSLAE